MLRYLKLRSKVYDPEIAETIDECGGPRLVLSEICRECVRRYRDLPACGTYTLPSIIFLAFNWTESSRGHEFWSNIFQKLTNFP